MNWYHTVTLEIFNKYGGNNLTPNQNLVIAQSVQKYIVATKRLQRDQLLPRISYPPVPTQLHTIPFTNPTLILQLIKNMYHYFSNMPSCEYVYFCICITKRKGSFKLV